MCVEVIPTKNRPSNRRSWDLTARKQALASSSMGHRLAPIRRQYSPFSDLNMSSFAADGTIRECEIAPRIRIREPCVQVRYRVLCIAIAMHGRWSCRVPNREPLLRYEFQ